MVGKARADHFSPKIKYYARSRMTDLVPCTDDIDGDETVYGCAHASTDVMMDVTAEPRVWCGVWCGVLARVATRVVLARGAHRTRGACHSASLSVVCSRVCVPSHGGRRTRVVVRRTVCARGGVCVETCASESARAVAHARSSDMSGGH